MLKLETKGEYADVLEKQLFNGIISGISLDGTHFFYVNPLLADPDISAHNPSRNHVLTHRAEWFGCACCPSNVARLIASVDQYIYAVKEDVILSHQFISNQATFENGVTIQQESNFPWEGTINYKVENTSDEPCILGIRIPQWSQKNARLSINGETQDYQLNDGFIYLEAVPGTTSIELLLDMSIKKYQSNTNVVYNFGKVAIQRGPLVYCLEETDQEKSVWKYSLAPNGQLDYRFESELLGGLGVIYAAAKTPEEEKEPSLYHEYIPTKWKDAKIKLIPYYAWANREEGNMAVWLDQEKN